MKTIVILCGIPCSGKSTWTWNLINDNYGFIDVISRDVIREKLYGKDYKQNNFYETNITFRFNSRLNQSLKDGLCDMIILDNCHTKESYLDQIINQYKDCNIQVKFFDCSLIKAYYRNYLRYYKIKKWIPLKVIYNMYKNYNKINKKKYEQYMVY